MTFTLMELCLGTLAVVFWIVAKVSDNLNCEQKKVIEEQRKLMANKDKAYTALSEQRDVEAATVNQLVEALNLATDIIANDHQGNDVGERLVELRDVVKEILAGNERFEEAEKEEEWPDEITEES